MNELKRCPFCGKENTVAGSTERMILGWWYACEDCFENRKGGVHEDRWNTRPIEDALNARIAQLEEENDRLQDGWFRDETICPDGSLRPKVSDLLNRIAELEEAQRWIPVSERLPEERQNVLALDKTGTAYHWEYLRSLSNIFVSYYTHWMPLPQPPEVEGCEDVHLDCKITQLPEVKE